MPTAVSCRAARSAKSGFTAASVIKGYWNNPKATAESFTAGFWHSGDLGSIDRENFVRVFDRQKDMINRGGLKIYSAEVESVLAGHPAVVESAIVAKPCPVLGERVHAVVVTRHEVSAEALRAWCAERLSDYKVPETMTVTPDPLPRNANGKVIKRQLREALCCRAVVTNGATVSAHCLLAARCVRSVRRQAPRRRSRPR